MKKIKDDLIWVFKLYALNVVLPLIATVMNILWVGILGIETKFGFLMNFKIIWINYYITGSFLNIDAWRWHLGLLFCSFLCVKFSD